MDDDLVNKIKHLARSKNKKQIASALNIDYEKLRRICRKHNIKTMEPESRTMVEVENITRMAIKHGVKKTAEHFNVSNDVVKNCNRRYAKFKKENVVKVNSEEMGDLRKRALNYASKKNYSGEGEDFAQWVCLQNLRGRKTANLKFLWIDYLRERFGNVRGSKNRIKESHSGLTIASTHSDPAEHIIDVASEEPGAKEMELLDNINSIKFKNSLARAIVILRYVYGLQTTEIGQVFKLSPGRVSQILDEGLHQLRVVFS